MNQASKRKLENELLAMGLNGLSEGETCDVFAGLIDQWPGNKHDFLRDLLNECDREKRTDLYTALVPRIRSFRPLSFSDYEARIAIKAGEMVSQGRMRVEGDSPRPIEIGEKKYAVSSQADSIGAIATLKCHKCRATTTFLADTPAGAMIEGRKAGWKRDLVLNKEVCPKCPLVTKAAKVTLA